MKKSWLVLAIALVLAWMSLAWFLGLWLGIDAQLIWYLRGGLGLIGLIGFAGYLFLSAESGADSSGRGGDDVAGEIDGTLGEASKALQSSKGVRRMNSLPAVFLLGDSGAGKTGILAKSGIEPELMGGGRAMSLWYARQTLFIDASAAAFSKAALRKRIFKKLVPGQAGIDGPPSRSALLLVDCELFLSADGAAAIAEKSLEYQVMLSELAGEMGCHVPVYVAFTKADKIPHFREYADNLSAPEASDVLGVSLPVPKGEKPQGNGDPQARRVTNAFKTIAWALADRRALYLAREQSPAKLADVYEFPREFSKLRPLVVEFLAELCRANGSGAVPFLRGFYFTGELDSKPIYMQRLFSDVFLADKMETVSASGLSGGRSAMRWATLLLAAASLLTIAWLSVSFTRNDALVKEALDDSRPSATDSLERLSRMQQTLAKLDAFQRGGVPLSYRPLYKGNDIRMPLETSYYAMFRRLLLEPSLQSLQKICANPSAYDAQGYQYVYDALKAYLITTVQHQRSTPAFLTPILVRHWRNEKSVSIERENMARRNFAFYAQQLAASNPYPALGKLDASAVAAARAYLNDFEPGERIYGDMLSSAADKQKPVTFNVDYPGSAATVVNAYLVQPWFTKAGYVNFQRELKQIDRYTGSESWVLGEEANIITDKQKLAEALRERFQREFNEAWIAFIGATSLTRFENIPDAATKLRSLGGVESPLLLNFCLASENTSVEDEKVKQKFQPLHVVTPAGCQRQLTSAAIMPYVSALNELAIGLSAVGPISQARQADVRMAQAMTRRADDAAGKLAQGFRKDPKDAASPVLAKTNQLLKEPARRVEALLNAGK